MLFNVQQPLVLLTLFEQFSRPPTRKNRKFTTSKNAHKYIGLSSTVEILLAKVEDRARFWRGHRGWRRPLAFLAHLPNA